MTKNKLEMINAEEFKQNRKALNLTQAELAKELCCKGGYRVMSAIETGRKKPSDILLRAFELLILNRKK